MTEDASDAKLDALEAEFLKRHVVAVDRVVRRWGFTG